MQPKILLIAFLILLSLTFALWDLIGAPLVSKSQSPQITELDITPKPFTFKTLDDKTFSHDNLKGKIIVLNFWATWCTPCAVEFPDLIKFTSAYPEDVVFLAMSVDEDVGNVHRFISRFEDKPQPNRIIGLDTDKTISQDIFQTTKFPETYILDRNGVIKRHIAGVIDWSGPDIRKDIESLIARKAENP